MMPGGSILPFPQPPIPMMPNPAYQQWMQQAQAWQQEKQRRDQQFLKACAYIKEDAAKRYNIDIEADSTIAADEEAEKASRTQFLQAITPFLEMAIPQMQNNPVIAPLIGKMIMFAVRAFPVSRQLDDAFEDAIQKLEAMPPNPQMGQQGGKNTKSPMEIQAEAQIEKGKQQTDLAVAQARSQSDQAANAIKLMQLYQQAQGDQAKLAAEAQKSQAELALQGRIEAGREALETARVQHMVARDMTGLV